MNRIMLTYDNSPWRQSECGIWHNSALNNEKLPEQSWSDDHIYAERYSFRCIDEAEWVRRCDLGQNDLSA